MRSRWGTNGGKSTVTTSQTISSLIRYFHRCGVEDIDGFSINDVLQFRNDCVTYHQIDFVLADAE